MTDQERREQDDDPCGGTGAVPCWNPGGPCENKVCELCGPCQACQERREQDRAAMLDVDALIRSHDTPTQVRLLAYELRDTRRALAAACAEAVKPYEERERRVRQSVKDWREVADGDERWLSGPRVSVSAASELPALIAQARSHADDLTAALDGEVRDA